MTIHVGFIKKLIKLTYLIQFLSYENKDRLQID